MLKRLDPLSRLPELECLSLGDTGFDRVFDVRDLRLHRDLLQPSTRPFPARILDPNRARATLRPNIHPRLIFRPKRVTRVWGTSSQPNRQQSQVLLASKRTGCKVEPRRRIQLCDSNRVRNRRPDPQRRKRPVDLEWCSLHDHGRELATSSLRPETQGRSGCPGSGRGVRLGRPLLQLAPRNKRKYDAYKKERATR